MATGRRAKVGRSIGQFEPYSQEIGAETTFATNTIRATLRWTRRWSGTGLMLCAVVSIGCTHRAGPTAALGPLQANPREAAPTLTAAAHDRDRDRDRDREAIVHALNRLGYGPRPGDVDRVREQGLARWIDDQLHPERIDDSALERKLSRYPTLQMSPVEVLSAFPPRQLIEATTRHLRKDLGFSDAQIREIYPEGLPAGAEAPSKGGLESPTRLLTELRHAKIVRAIESERQLQEVLTDFWFNHFNVYANKGASRWWITSYERDAIRPHALGKFRDLLGATSRHPAMLFYLDNWLSAAPGSRAYGLAIRVPTAQQAEELGLPPGGLPLRFLRQRGVDTEALEQSIAQRIERQTRAQAVRKPRPDRDDPNRRRGLNENYARELLELHTLGVNGGYSQADIVDVARAFTGWTIVRREAGQGFAFLDEWHDTGAKNVLGRPLTRTGIGEGEEVLDLLAAHPMTARFVSTKLARRFVSDDPPAALIDRMAAAFLASDGDIRSVLIAMIDAPEFWSEETIRAKVKSPFEFVVSMVRSTDAKVNPHSRLLQTAAAVTGMDLDADPNADPNADSDAAAVPTPDLDRYIRNLGQPLYLAGPPTGFGDTAESWISAGSMLDRFRVAIRFAGNRIGGVDVTLPRSVARAEGEAELLRQLEDRVLGRAIEPASRAALLEQLQRSPEEWEALGLPRGYAGTHRGRARLALGWLLASPEFQRR